MAIENGPSEDAFPIENGDFPASHVSLPEGNLHFFHVFCPLEVISLHLKIGLNAPKGNEKVFQPSIFTGYVSFREGIYSKP